MWKQNVDLINCDIHWEDGSRENSGDGSCI